MFHVECELYDYRLCIISTPKMCPHYRMGWHSIFSGAVLALLASGLAWRSLRRQDDYSPLILIGADWDNARSLDGLSVSEKWRWDN